MDKVRFTIVFNENIATSLTFATLTTTDQDSSNTYTYSLVGGSRDYDNNLFYIDGDKLKIKTSPDSETQSSYSIRIQSTDSYWNQYSKAWTLSVKDIKIEKDLTFHDIKYKDPENIFELLYGKQLQDHFLEKMMIERYHNHFLSLMNLKNATEKTFQMQNTLRLSM